MASIVGSLDERQNPVLKIHVAGVKNLGNPVEFSALIDTGFSGFLSMPLIRAFPLGLPLIGSTSVELADGKTHDKLLAECQVTLGENTRMGSVILEPGSKEVLIGMGFLRVFGLYMVVSSFGVVLAEESELVKVIEAQVAKTAPPAGGSPPHDSQPTKTPPGEDQ